MKYHKYKEVVKNDEMLNDIWSESLGTGISFISVLFLFSFIAIGSAVFMLFRVKCDGATIEGLSIAKRLKYVLKDCGFPLLIIMLLVVIVIFCAVPTMYMLCK